MTIPMHSWTGSIHVQLICQTLSASNKNPHKKDPVMSPWSIELNLTINYKLWLYMTYIWYDITSYYDQWRVDAWNDLVTKMTKITSTWLMSKLADVQIRNLRKINRNKLNVRLIYKTKILFHLHKPKQIIHRSIRVSRVVGGQPVGMVNNIWTVQHVPTH